MLGYLWLNKQTHFLFVYSTRKQNFRHLQWVLSDVLVEVYVIVIVCKGSGERVIVGDHEIFLREVLALLEFEHICNRAKIVSDMEITGWLDSS